MEVALAGPRKEENHHGWRVWDGIYLRAHHPQARGEGGEKLVDNGCAVDPTHLPTIIDNEFKGMEDAFKNA